MQLIRNLFPKLRVAARGSVIKVIGEDGETSTIGVSTVAGHTALTRTPAGASSSAAVRVS